MCASQMTAVGALVRATAEDQRPSSFSVTVVDADGIEYGIGVDSASDEASESDAGSNSGSATDSDQASGSETDSQADDSS